MKKVVILFIALISFHCVYPQASGYMGSRFSLNVNLGITPDYKTTNVLDYKDKKLKFRMPLSGDFSFVAGNKVSVGVGYSTVVMKGSFSYFYFNIDGDNYYDTRVSGIANYRTNILSCYVEWHPKTDYAILDNYFRLGVSRASITNTDYEFMMTEPAAQPHYHSFPESISALALNQKVSKFGMYYEFGNRLPLNNHLLLFYGISGRIFPYFNNQYGSYNNCFNPDLDISFITDLGKNRLMWSSAFNFNCGLTWAF